MNIICYNGLMVKAKNKVKVSKEQQQASMDAMIWITLGLLMAVGGFIWLTTIGTDNGQFAPTLGGATLVAIGLLIAGSALFILSAIVLSTSIQKRKAAKRKK